MQRAIGPAGYIATAGDIIFLTPAVLDNLSNKPSRFVVDEVVEVMATPSASTDVLG